MIISIRGVQYRVAYDQVYGAHLLPFNGFYPEEGFADMIWTKDAWIFQNMFKPGIRVLPHKQEVPPNVHP